MLILPDTLQVLLPRFTSMAGNTASKSKVSGLFIKALTTCVAKFLELSGYCMVINFTLHTKSFWLLMQFERLKHKFPN